MDRPDVPVAVMDNVACLLSNDWNAELTVMCKDGTLCGGLSGITFRQFDVTAISNTQQPTPDIQLYANPVGCELVLAGCKAGTPIHIYNMEGRLLQSLQAVEGKTIVSTDQLPVGIYLLKVGDTTMKFFRPYGAGDSGVQYDISLADGQHLTWSGLTIVSGQGEDKWLIRKPGLTSGGTDISLVASISVAPLADRTWKAPTYPDDYRNLSGWNNRSKWNLANIHDPSVMLADDGYYYMYCTDAGFGNPQSGHGHFHCRRSRNLVDWEYLGATMNTTPAWVTDSLNSERRRLGLSEIASPQFGYWAPCTRNLGNGLYRMYYCIVVDNYIKTGKANTADNFDNSWTERAFIGVMETSTPEKVGSWKDKGFVVCSISDKGKNWNRTNTNDWSAYFRYNAIDPTYIVTPEGEHWLIFGSWHSGFAAMQLDAATGKPLQPVPPFYSSQSELNKVMKRVYTRDASSRWQGAEAPEVIYNPETDYYYLFMAYDALDVPYNTRVVRARHIDGPYYTKGGTNVTANGGQAFPIVTHPYKFGDDHGWVGISHCAVFSDNQGNWYYCSQGRFPNGYDDWAPNAIMLGHVRSIRWTDDGWPVVMPERYGGVPQKPIGESEFVGSWQNITLSYDYGKQRTSVNFSLGEDHKVSGTWQNGQTWQWDAEKRILTIGTQKLYVQRETDWETGTEANNIHNGRQQTLVYAGINSSGNSLYWGVKR